MTKKIKTKEPTPVRPTNSRCFRCDGTKLICDICGESEVACTCEPWDDPTFSPCDDCGGTGE